jgi:hypothetical protein
MACHPESLSTAEVQGSRSRDLAFTELNEGRYPNSKVPPIYRYDKVATAMSISPMRFSSASFTDAISEAAPGPARYQRTDSDTAPAHRHPPRMRLATCPRGRRYPAALGRPARRLGG